MKKEHILNEIRRTADKETNQALGKAKLEKETGIQEKDWSGIYWANYGEAVKEAGCKPSEYQKAFEEEWVVKQLIDFIDKKNKFPTRVELKLERRNNKEETIKISRVITFLEQNLKWQKKLLNIVKRIMCFQMYSKFVDQYVNLMKQIM